MWQDFVAAAVALLAAGYLAWRLLRPRGSCSPACDRCPADSTADEKTLVQLQPPEESPPETASKTQG